MKRSQPSGYENRKKKEKRDEEDKSQAYSLLKYYTKRDEPADVNDISQNSVEFGNSDERNQTHQDENENQSRESEQQEVHISDISDPGNWENIDTALRDLLVKKGPMKRLSSDYQFPKDSTGRHFSQSFYIRNMVNGEKQDRRWLIYFNTIMDQALVSLESRFEQFQRYENIFGFLFDLKKLKATSDDILRESCVNLDASLKFGMQSDIDGYELFLELKILRNILPNEVCKPIEVLDFLKKMEGCYPNTGIAYRILLTIPVSVATAERSFSKLKLIKNYLRSTMSQERLNGLALLSIETNMVKELDYVNLMNDFAVKNARRTIFKH